MPSRAPSADGERGFAEPPWRHGVVAAAIPDYSFADRTAMLRSASRGSEPAPVRGGWRPT